MITKILESNKFRVTYKVENRSVAQGYEVKEVVVTADTSSDACAKVRQDEPYARDIKATRARELEQPNDPSYNIEGEGPGKDPFDSGIPIKDEDEEGDYDSSERY